MGAYHEGKGIIRTSRDNKTVLLLCLYGHIVDTLPMKNWAGSWAEAYWPDKVVRCYGTLPKDTAKHT